MSQVVMMRVSRAIAADPFALVELARFLEDGAGDAKLADVVKHGRAPEPAGTAGRQAEAMRHARAQVADPP